MNGYIEEGAWASCSFDLAGTPQQLQRRFEPGESFSVGYSSGKRLLTIEDKITKEKFICKSPAKAWGGLVVLVGGIVGGLIIVASGPVGWALVGAFAAVTVAAAVGGAIGGIIAACNHDCAGPQSEGTWRSYKTKVLIKGEKPILYNKSVLECANGGFLIASESQARAQEVSDAMKWQARMEFGLQLLSNALIGVVTGYNAIDKPKPGEVGEIDYDVLSPFVEVASYVHTDIVRATSGDTPLESGVIGAGYTAGSFAMGLGSRFIPIMDQPWINALSSEFKLQDLGPALITTGIGYLSDEGEAALNNSTTAVIVSIEVAQEDFSGKSIIATDL